MKPAGILGKTKIGGLHPPYKEPAPNEPNGHLVGRVKTRRNRWETEDWRASPALSNKDDGPGWRDVDAWSYNPSRESVGDHRPWFDEINKNDDQRRSFPILDRLMGQVIVIDMKSPYVCLGRLVGGDATFLELVDADLHDFATARRHGKFTSTIRSGWGFVETGLAS